jgi:hypothetical protein
MKSLILMTTLLCLTVHAQPGLPCLRNTVHAFPGQTIPPASVALTSIVPTSNSVGGHWLSVKNWNEASAVAVENDSIVWVGTSVGLVRWNVVTGSYQTIDRNNRLPFTSVTAMAFDRQRALWISTSQGMVRYKDGNYTAFSSSTDNLPNTSFSNIAIDSANNIYVCHGSYSTTDDYIPGGVAIFNGTSWTHIDIPYSFGYGNGLGIVVHHDTVWIGGRDALYILVGCLIQVAPNWSFNGAYSIAEDYQGNLWCLTFDAKLLRYSSGTWMSVATGVTYGHSIYSDPNRGFWLSGASMTTPYRIDFTMLQNGARCQSWDPPGCCKVPDAPDGFNAHSTLTSNAQFFGSMGSGLFQFDGSNWKTYRVPVILAQNKISGLGCGPNNEIYVSTPSFTYLTDGQNWQTIGTSVTGVFGDNKDFRISPNGSFWTNHGQLRLNRNSNSGYVSGLDFDQDGNLWVTYPLTRWSWPGLDPTIIQDSVMGFSGNSYAQFMDICCDGRNRIWAAAWYYGGAMFDQSDWHLFPHSDTTLPNGSYDLVFCDTHGRTWFGTNQELPNYGFTVFDGNSWRTYYSQKSFFYNIVYQIAEDHFGNVWLATWGGLLKFDGTNFTIIDSENSPLETNDIRAVTVDQRGNIWLGTSSGLYIYNPLVDIQLGTYTYSSPVDSFSVASVLGHITATFHPRESSTTPLLYRLERRRISRRFWPVAEIQPSSITSSIQLSDTSDIEGKYYYRIEEVQTNGAVRYSSEVQATVVLPTSFSVSHNYPNPVRSTTIFDIEMPRSDLITLRIYDIMGREVPLGVSRFLSRGYHSIHLDMSSMPSGTYVYSIDALNNKTFGRFVVFK